MPCTSRSAFSSLYNYHFGVYMYVDSFQGGMKVIRHAGVDSRMIILDDQARQQKTLHLNATFHPSWAGIPDKACDG